jgi:FlaA1/EpsC-like NDP-sugar epimerase
MFRRIRNLLHSENSVLSDGKKTVVVGAGIAGENVIEEIKSNPDLGMDIIGIIDDNKDKWGQKIQGVTILGGRDKIKSLALEGILEEVIIAMPSADGEQISEVVKVCSEARVGFRIVPRVKEIIEGRAHIANIRYVQVEDLLGRPVVREDIAGLKSFFKNKKVLITGAAGSIGSELCRQIAAYTPSEIIFLDWWENGLFQLENELKDLYPKGNYHFVIANIQDREKVRKVFEDFKPNYVFHAAAYKHVPLMEDNPEEAVKNNIFGTLNVAEEAKKSKVEKFVLISTDKAANPVNVMGTTKLFTEGIGKMLNGDTKYMAVRFGNVLDSYGSVIPTFRKQIEKGGPVTVTDKRMTRYFMTIPEAAQLILKAASLGNGGELFVLDMGEPVKIIDLAENIIRLSGLVPERDIKIVFTGARKGEKIAEDLFNEKEKLKSTKDKKIFITESQGLDINKLPSVLKNLKIYAEKGDSKKIRQEFRKIISSNL